MTMSSHGLGSGPHVTSSDSSAPIGFGPLPFLALDIVASLALGFGAFFAADFGWFASIMIGWLGGAAIAIALAAVIVQGMKLLSPAILRFSPHDGPDEPWQARKDRRSHSQLVEAWDKDRLQESYNTKRDNPDRAA